MNDRLLSVHVVGYITSVTLLALRLKYFHPVPYGLPVHEAR